MKTNGDIIRRMPALQVFGGGRMKTLKEIESVTQISLDFGYLQPVNATCEKCGDQLYLIVDFANHVKLKRLECPEKGGGEDGDIA